MHLARSRVSQNGQITVFLGCIAKSNGRISWPSSTSRESPASGEEAAVIALPSACSQASSATIWRGGHGRRIAMVGGAAEGVLTLVSHH